MFTPSRPPPRLNGTEDAVLLRHRRLDKFSP